MGGETKIIIDSDMKMKIFLQCMLLALLTTGGVQARQGRAGQRLQRIHAAKMAYITDRMGLSAEQGVQFAPVYNEYERELRGIRRSYYKGGLPGGDGDDIPARQQIDDNLDYQQDVISLKRKYNDKFLKVISAKQLADMYTAEREFRQMLIQRLRERRGVQGGRR